MYLLLIFLPAVSSFLAGFFGKQLGSFGTSFVSTACLFLSFSISTAVFYEAALLGCCTYVKLAPWIHCETLSVDWGFMFDSLTAVMCLVVTSVSFFVHMYSIEYMSHDPHLPRFMSYLSLFTFFMLILVTADNLVQMFIGWEGVGLCSYLLINFWFTRIQANKAAVKAMVLNRVGDFSLLIGIMLIFYYLKVVDYPSISALVPFLTEEICIIEYRFKVLTVVGVFLFFGAVGKSAQLGLHTWLPDAMEGPTPVSALIHAATMVTAGVFLLARLSNVFERLDNVLKFIVVLGSVTSLFASTTGLAQNDLKRVIAYSTCSQLGYMTFACGLSGYSISIFHLSNHAFFKALLFLSAGSVIHAINDEQDMRKMGGLKNLLPFTYSVTVIGTLALMGFPFLAGFYSKDSLLELAFSKYDIFSVLAYVLGTSVAFLTAFYSTRLLYLTFLSKPNGYKTIITRAQDSGVPVSLTLGLLAVPSIFIGYTTKDMLTGAGSIFFNGSVYLKATHLSAVDAEFIPLLTIKLLPVCLSLFGSILAFVLYTYSTKTLVFIKTTLLGRKVYQFLNKKWFFDKIYNELFGQMFFRLGFSTSYKLIDRGVFEALGPTGLSTVLPMGALDLRKTQSGAVYHYTLTILVGVSFMLFFRHLLGSGLLLNTACFSIGVFFSYLLTHDKEGR